ncbi:MAG TPA: TolC family protein, partial [Reyranella sp.]|nr:TolC family protein [Reyranella sp.]
MNSKWIAARAFLSLVAAAVIGGCMVGPDYRRPDVVTPTGYKEGIGWKTAQPQDAVARGKWWEIFGDPQLNALIAQIDISNQNVKLAEAQWRQATAVVEQARAAFYPVFTLTNNDSRSRSPSLANAPVNSTKPVNTFSLALNASWAPDLWGSVRRTVESDVASAQAREADLANARLLAQAQLALDYFQLRVVDTQRQFLNDTV